MKYKMLVVVDYENDFVNGALGFSGAEKLDAGIAKKIRDYEKMGGIIVRTMDTHFKNYLETREGKNLPIVHCIFNTKGWEMYGETKKAWDEVSERMATHSLDKRSFGVGPSLMLELVELLHMSGIRPSDIETIEFVGLVSNICVISNVVVFQSAFPESTMLVNPNLTDSFDKELHEATMKVLSGLQVKLIDN